MSEFKWTWDYIDDNMTLPRYYSISDYWEKYPPLHLASLAHMGFELKKSKKKKTDNEELSEEEFNDLAQLFGGFSEQ